MELAEVVNPQFAFPVVGVVLCAVLVFALGFKSPVQPPSFDFDDDKPKSKKQLKRAKKLQNGHVGGGSELPNVPSSINSSKPLKQASGNKQAAEKSEVSKQKKKPATPKTTVSAEKKDELEVTKEQEAGEWTTALSRKEKKMRGKKDERAEKVLDDGWPEEASPDVSQQVQTKPPEPLPEPDSPSGDVLESKKPLEQRTTKKDKKRKNTNDSSPTTIPVISKPVVTPAKPEVEEKSANEDEKGEETTSETAPEKAKDRVDAAAMILTPMETPERRSPRKKKKRSTRLPEDVATGLPGGGELVEGAVSVEAEGVVRETSVPDTAAAIADAMQEIQDVECREAEELSLRESEMASSDEPKSARSPKKKKKRDREKFQESSRLSSSPEASHLERQSADSKTELDVSQTHPHSAGAAADRLEASILEDSSSVRSSQPEGGESSSKPSTPSEEQSKVSFDELGDWQEAKPVKKKKKPRREN